MAMSAIVSAGTVGWGTTWSAFANRSQSERPMTMPSGTPMMHADADGDAGLPGDGRGELSAGEAERLEQRELASAATHRREQGEAERDDRAGGERGAEQRGRVAHRAVVDDLGGTLHRARPWAGRGL